MIIAAALCPAPPLLLPALPVPHEVLPELRIACADAVGELVAAGPDLVAVVGPAETTEAWDPVRADRAGFVCAWAWPGWVGRAGLAGRAWAGRAGLGGVVADIAWCRKAGCSTRAGSRVAGELRSVAGEEPGGGCAQLGKELAGLARAGGAARGGRWQCLPGAQGPWIPGREQCRVRRRGLERAVRHR